MAARGGRGGGGRGTAGRTGPAVPRAPAAPTLPDVPDAPDAPDAPGGSARPEPPGRLGELSRRGVELARAAAGEVVPLVSLTGLRGAVVEAAWSSVHLALYPLGLVRDQPEMSERYHLGDLSPHQRGLVVGDVEAAGTPILLLHGMLDNRIVFSVLRHRLRRRGFGRVFTLNYSPTTNDIRQAGRALSGAVEELVARTGHERIHVIGHSLGGLIARYYVQRLGGDERVHTLVTLGTPHRGSLLAYGMSVRLCRQLRPGSDLFTELEQPAPACRTRFVAYYSDTDQVLVPHDSGRIAHPDLTVRNVRLHGVGHMSLPIQPGVVREITTVLSQLDSDGATLTCGVTRLDPSA